MKWQGLGTGQILGVLWAWHWQLVDRKNLVNQILMISNHISTETHQANKKKENLESPATGSYTHHVPISWKLFEFQCLFTNLLEVLTILIIVDMQNLDLS